MKAVGVAMVAFLYGFLAGVVVITKSSADNGRTQRAIERHKARYNPETGKFEWTDKDFAYVVSNEELVDEPQK